MRTGDLIGGRYRLEDACGWGSGGIVWTAFDQKLKRLVALKKPHLMASQADRLRFRREAETAAQVYHPNTVSVFDTVDDDECWLVMEHAPAASLETVLADNTRLPADRVARIGFQIAAALVAVHAKGIVHRDVKPGNILVDDGDFAKLTDFGISLWREVTLTHDGSFSGTAGYAAPEVADGRRATAASDVFSLGATLFAAVEGTPPFGTGEPDEVLDRVRRNERHPMTHAGPLATPLAEMLEPRPERRPTAEQVLRLLGGDGDDGTPVPTLRTTARACRPRWRRPVYRWGAAAVLIAAAATVTVTLLVSNASNTPSGLVGDERTPDPCALLDSDELEARFGTTALDSTVGNFNRCDALIGIRDADPLDLEVQLVNQASHEMVGEPLAVINRESDTDTCDRTVVVDDNYGVRVTAKQEPSRNSVNLCEVADVAVDSVLDVLGRGPIPRRVAPFSRDSLAHLDACELLDGRVLAALSPDGPDPEPEFGRWACRWETPEEDVEVRLRYDQHATEELLQAPRVRLGDHDAVVEADADTGCTVRVFHHPGGKPRGTVDVTVAGDRAEDYCAVAREFATTAAAALPR
ncbi:serine/threonine-protein kinase [Actinophytocola sediminis]